MSALAWVKEKALLLALALVGALCLFLGVSLWHAKASMTRAQNKWLVREVELNAEILGYRRVIEDSNEEVDRWKAEGDRLRAAAEAEARVQTEKLKASQAEAARLRNRPMPEDPTLRRDAVAPDVRALVKDWEGR